jgi:hypothetical protein
MSDDYANARCCAIRADSGKRCRGRWATALPCTFAWDPITGVGVDGPWVVLCYRHRRVWERRRVSKIRMRVFRGWLGPANTYWYGTAVLRDHVSWLPAAWWWARRRDTTFGEMHRRDAA